MGVALLSFGLVTAHVSYFTSAQLISGKCNLGFDALCSHRINASPDLAPLLFELALVHEPLLRPVTLCPAVSMRSKATNGLWFKVGEGMLARDFLGRHVRLLCCVRPHGGRCSSDVG